MDERSFNLMFQDGHVRLEIRKSATRLFVDLEPQQIEELIAKLASMRRELKPEVPRVLPDGEHRGAEIDPIWEVKLVPVAGQKALCIRSVGMGWIPFLLPEAEAQKLGAALSVNLNPPSFQTQVRH